MFAQFCLCSLVICTVTSVIDAKPSRPLLRGVTIRNWPYADRPSDRFEGFVVDLMNLIAEHAGFEYTLYFSPDGKYGTESPSGHINGMIGDVYRHKADFAIADLTVTESRRKFIDFTEPFLENQLSAIVRRDDAVGLRTLEDLVTMNEINRATETGYAPQSRGVIAYGTYRTGSTFYHLSQSRDPVAVRMYSWMLRNPKALVTSAKEGFDRVNAGRYAFIVESTFAEYLAGLYCNLTTLYDTRNMYPRQFAIALPKGSPYMEPFNRAIRELKANGQIDKLRALYWSSRCNSINQNVNRNNDNSNHIPKVQVAPSPPKPVSPGTSNGPVHIPSVQTTVTTRRGNENSDDRSSGNRVEPSQIQWSNGHRTPYQNGHNHHHGRVQPNTRDHDQDNYLESRYHRRGYQHASTSPAASSAPSSHATVWSWSHISTLAMLAVCSMLLSVRATH